MSSLAFGRPAKTEHAPYYETYTSKVQGDDILAALKGQMSATLKTLAGISEEQSLFRYEQGKWSVKELLGHVIDTERIMAYRALRIARNDKTPIEGFDQDPYIENADFDSCSLKELAAEFALVRESNIFMFRHLAEEAWSRSGTASGYEVTVRALAYIIAGHELHHIGILQERYLR
ncbi:MAG: DinB family protein [Pyrinomonadaceae bacterium]